MSDLTRDQKLDKILVQQTTLLDLVARLTAVVEKLQTAPAATAPARREPEPEAVAFRRRMAEQPAAPTDPVPMTDSANRAATLRAQLRGESA